MAPTDELTPRIRRVLCAVVVAAWGCGGEGGTPPLPLPASPSANQTARGFDALAPWVSFYGSADEMGSLDRVAGTFRIINVDADPDQGSFSPEQIALMRAGGRNRVISYFNLGSCERYRSYWSRAPAGFVPCAENRAARLGPYGGFPDEEWMDVGNSDYQRLLVEYVAPRLVAQGVDGFFFDNLEIVEHGPADAEGPCSASCSQGGLDLVRRLRERFPDLLFVMQNATGPITRTGRTGGVPFVALLDGVSHEEVFAPAPDAAAQAELEAWRALSLGPGGRSFFIGTEDYVGSCSNVDGARSAYERSRALGFSPYATDASAGQRTVCYWPF